MNKASVKTTIEQPKESDYSEISEMLFDNFDYAQNYAGLTDVQRNTYKAANTAEGVRETCQNPDNIDSFVVKVVNEEGQEVVAGYAVVRGEGPATSVETAEIRRFHVGRKMARKGIGQYLLNAAEQSARNVGAQYVEVLSSGESNTWFEKNGYICVETAKTRRGVFSNVLDLDAPDYHKMRKHLKEEEASDEY
ncbi:MAG: GNAT family N-acetyltransferase [Candidatus Nomurabacteria bacterium]|jgi:N-acetylglutamate synthase-like GNAT family acetyltransferase|nr:GNAT family N-acetyltransferase [Candidatus Nomurabacteria bacterium]